MVLGDFVAVGVSFGVYEPPADGPRTHSVDQLTEDKVSEERVRK